jgi:hypothetical protein
VFWAKEERLANTKNIKNKYVLGFMAEFGLNDKWIKQPLLAIAHKQAFEPGFRKGEN